LSPVASDAESSTSTTSKSNKQNKDDSDEDDDDKDSPSKRRMQQGRRSELDKLLEAVDTSFHFETAAAERKRLSETKLEPLEIDCSDTGSETSCKVATKRKINAVEKSPGRKKLKGSNNLLKTASPGSAQRSEDEQEDEDDDCVWDGWEKLDEDLNKITDDPVEIKKLHFSFETVPLKESWFLTYQRQDRGDEIVFYPSQTTNPFHLPYQLPYSAFLLNKPVKREPESSHDQSKASSPVRQSSETSKQGEKRKISDCDSTDSSEEVRRGRAGRPSKLDRARAAHLYESNYRVSPRCHASTKSLGLGIADIDDLEEAYLFQDERDLGLSALSSLPAHLARDENSNDSFSSSSTGARASVKSESKSESHSEMVTLAKSLDTLLQDPSDLAAPDSAPAKVPPTRSRVSSDQLLSPKKVKKKKKVSVDGRGYEPLDQLVADNIDPVLLDCLEDELPTVPGPLLDLDEDPMELLSSFSSCRSMAVCNQRWLRPNNRDTVSSAKKDPKNKKVFDPLKPKRVIIYKDDLPGFSLDGDDEDEKLPVSKRGKPRAAPGDKAPESPNKAEKDSKKKTKISKKAVEPPKDETAVEEEVTQSDEDLESVESFSSTSSSTSKKRRKTNKTGFPTPKKKKKTNQEESVKIKKSSESQKSPSKTDSKASKKSPKKIGPSSQKKIDEFIIKKGKASPVASASKRSVALKAKNYSEIESDSESLFDASLMTPVKSLKNSSVQSSLKKSIDQPVGKRKKSSVQ